MPYCDLQLGHVWTLLGLGWLKMIPGGGQTGLNERRRVGLAGTPGRVTIALQAVGQLLDWEQGAIEQNQATGRAVLHQGPGQQRMAMGRFVPDSQVH